ncbi:MAG: recombinase family protein, partial [Candidatus Pacebacteria bacterium]|nr:recombinase family protein [Candidatus Paceibacterota bacterium]
MKKLYTRRVERNKKTKKSDSNLAIIYVRVSDSEQIDGTSLDAQVRLCREYLEKQGLVLACDPFIEKGESAKTTSRTM